MNSGGKIMKVILDIIGYITTIASILGMLVAVIYVTMGLFPLLWRLGLGRWKTRIAVFSKESERRESVKRDLAESGLFRKNNIESLGLEDVQRADQYAIIVLCDDMLDSLEDILNKKKSTAGLIIYATTTRLTPEKMSLLNNHPLVTLVNFRGRLISDLILMLMGVNYAKK